MADWQGWLALALGAGVLVAAVGGVGWLSPGRARRTGVVCCVLGAACLTVFGTLSLSGGPSAVWELLVVMLVQAPLVAVLIRNAWKDEPSRHGTIADSTEVGRG